MATVDGVLASLKSSDGAVAWRLVLEDGEIITKIDCGAQVVSIISTSDRSAGGVSRLRVLSEADGKQLWEAKGPGGLLQALQVKDKIFVVEGSSGTVSLRAGQTGRKEWETVLDEPVSVGTVNYEIAFSPSEEGGLKGNVLVGAIKGSGKGSVSFVQIDLATGEAVAGATTVHLQDAMDAKNALAVGDGLFLRRTDGSGVCKFEYNDVKKHLCVESSDLGTIETIAKGCNGHLVAISQEGVIHIIGVSDGSMRVAHSIKGHGISSQCVDNKVIVAYSDDSRSIKVKRVDFDGFTVSEVGVLQTASTPRWEIPGETRRLVQHVALGIGGKWAIQFSEGSTVAGKINEWSGHQFMPAWKREDGLAGITHSMFVDLPPPTAQNEEAWMQSQPSASRNLWIQLLILKTQLGLGRPEDVAAINEHQKLTNDLMRPTRDADGFRQQIIVSTIHNKVASLHSGDGRVLWEVNFGDEYSSLRIVKWFESESKEEVAVLLESSPGMTIYIIDVYKGTIIGEPFMLKSPDGDGLNIVPMPSSVVMDSGSQFGYCVTNSENRVLTVIPEGDKSIQDIFASQFQNMVRWQVSKDRKSVFGVRLHPKREPLELWRIQVVPTDDMGILDIVSKDGQESIYSAARAIYGGGVLMKNIDPNEILVAVGTQNKELPSKIIIYGINAVTGHVTYRQIHEVRYHIFLISAIILFLVVLTRLILSTTQGSSGPVHAILSEHWAAYNYWNEEQGRWYIGSIDSYFPQPEGLNAISLLLGATSEKKNVSAYDYTPKLIVQSQSYRTKYGASCLAVTKTAHGTAAKMLLYGIPSGEIVSIDRRMIDPRRPKVMPGTKPTKAQMYEGVPPFSPELPMAGPSFITLYHKIARLRRIDTAPAILESSSLVFAHGLDTFFIRLQPSKGFDMVPDDFPYALLVFMVVGLSVALVALRAVIQRKTLKMKWE